MSTDLSKMLEDAEVAYEARNYEEALRLCTMAIEQHPERYEGYEKRSKILHRLHRLEGAFADLERVMKLVPDAAAPYFTRASWKLSSDDYRGAVEDFAECLERDNGYFGESIYFYRAEAHLRMGEFDKALADCGKVSDDYWEMYFFGHKKRSKQDIMKDAAEGKRKST